MLFATSHRRNPDFTPQELRWPNRHARINCCGADEVFANTSLALAIRGCPCKQNATFRHGKIMLSATSYRSEIVFAKLRQGGRRRQTGNRSTS
jgi:hypothetical protein